MTMKATCGHEIDEGIPCSISSVSPEGILGTSYGTYCSECVLCFYQEGILLNKELVSIFDAQIDLAKKLGDLLKPYECLCQSKNPRDRSHVDPTHGCTDCQNLGLILDDPISWGVYEALTELPKIKWSVL
ncbi:hypothetical protein N9948_01625 [bacterium]|nr:hypothetical protein [bacterium]